MSSTLLSSTAGLLTWPAGAALASIASSLEWAFLGATGGAALAIVATRATRRRARVRPAASGASAPDADRAAMIEHVGPFLRYASDIILVLDGDLRVVDANEQAVKAYGYDIDELRKRTLHDLRAPRCVAELTGQQRTWDAPGGAQYESVHRRQDGTEFPVAVSVGAVPIGGRRLFLNIVRDITQRKKDEVQLRILNAAINAAPNSIIITDPNFLIEWVNPAFLRETGYSFKEVVGRNVRALKSAEPEHSRETDLKRAIAAGQIWRGELVNRRSNGSIYIEDATVTPVMDAGGTLTHMVGINSDVTHRRYAEIAARQTAERYRLLFEQNPHPMWIYERDTLRMLAVNEAALIKYGYTRQEFLELTLEVLQVDAAMFREYLRDLNSAVCRIPRLPHRTKAGAVFHVEITSHSLEWLGRKARLVLANDVTDRIRAEDALKESEARFSSAFENAPIGMGVAALDGRWLLVNRALCDLLGYTSDELRQLTIHAITHPDDRAATVVHARQLIRGEAAVSQAEKRYVTRTGVSVAILRSASLVRDANGAPQHFVVQVLDITAAKRAQQQIREQADLLNKTGDAIFVTDLARRITFWNRAAERVTGYAAGEAILQPVATILGPQVDARLEAAIATGTAPDEFRAEWVLSNRDDRPVTLDARTTLLRDDEGKPVGQLTIATDVTEKKRFEEQLLHSQRLDSLGMLAAGIAHDLNNVLAPIVMAAPMLRMNASDPTEIFLLETLDKAGQRGASLVRQILSFAHRPESEMVRIPPKHLLRDIAQVIEQTFPKSIVLRLEIPADLWPVLANPTHMHQVLLNLCVNARDAMPTGGTLALVGENRTIDAGASDLPPNARIGRWVVFDVTDTGTGIPADVLAHIWEPFFTTKPKGQGTGLGLPTVRGIVEKHGGFITVQTAPGTGTTFAVHLPAAAPSLEPAPPPASTASHGGKALVLVAEDEESIRTVTVHVLRKHGYRAITARNGAEAIALFKARAKDVALVLTDIDMPEVGGVAVAHAIHDLTPELPVLGMSGFDTPGTTPEKAATPFTMFLRKPFTAEILVDHVKRALEHRPDARRHP